MRIRNLLGALVAVVLAGSACAAPAADTQAGDASPAAGRPDAPTARDIVRAFAAAKMPAHNPRDNSGQSSGGLPGCVELLTTEDVSVYRFRSAAAARRFAGHGDGTQIATVVVSYGAARTPQRLRPRYVEIATAVVEGRPVPAAPAPDAAKAVAPEKSALARDMRCEGALAEIDQVVVNVEQLQDDLAGQQERFVRRMHSHVGFFDRPWLRGAPKDLAPSMQAVRDDTAALGRAVRTSSGAALTKAGSSFVTHARQLRARCAG